MQSFKQICGVELCPNCVKFAVFALMTLLDKDSIFSCSYCLALKLTRKHHLLIPPALQPAILSPLSMFILICWPSWWYSSAVALIKALNVGVFYGFHESKSRNWKAILHTASFFSLFLQMCSLLPQAHGQKCP